jgi:actin-related protein 8
MPRGKPKNADYAGGPVPFRFTTIPPPVAFLNAKNVSSTYGKSEGQSWWTKRDEWHERESKRKRAWVEPDELGDDVKGKGKEVSIEACPAVFLRARVLTILFGLWQAASDATDAAPQASEATETAANQTPPEDPSSRVLILQPGSRWLRVGRASDHMPISVPNVIARRVGDLDRESGPSHAPTTVCFSL